MDDGAPNEDVLECLANPRRRFAVFYLRQHSNPVPVAELASEITAWEQDAASTVSEEAVERVHVALHHNHLPRLEAVGLVELDPEREQVVANVGTQIAEQLRRQLVDMREHVVDD